MEENKKMNQKALITGITGQDGSYLAELLLSKGYEVHGIVRRGSTINTSRIDHLLHPEEQIFLHYGDLSDTNSIYNLMLNVKPSEIYNIGSMSHVRVSFDIPEYTGDITGIGVCRLLEATKNLIKHGILDKDTKFYQASSSEMFGISPPPQNEKTLFLPVSPYGCAKLYGFHMTRAFRFGYKMFACNGILFNHESPRRGETFVTKKIVRKAVQIKLGLENKIYLGNLEAKRDWGFAGDYMDAIYKIMHHEFPDDFVVATEEYHSIQEFAECVFKKLHLDLNDYIEIKDRYFRPNEVPELRGDATKIRKILGWKPKVTFNELIDRMIQDVMKEEEQYVEIKEIA
jgi:GDPmannose 4,6-dehydratase